MVDKLKEWMTFDLLTRLRRRCISAPWLALVLLAVLAPPMRAQPADSAAVVSAAQRYVEALASPRMRGRGYVDGGHRRAAEYLRRQFEQVGLEPVGGSYMQRFQLRADVFTEAPTLSVDGTPLALGTAFLPVAASASGQAERATPVVAVGAGLVLPEQGRDDYAGTSVEGAVVIIRGAVADSIRRSERIPAQAYARAARLQHAEDAGARAVIWLTDRLSLSGYSPYDATIPVFQVLPSVWPEEAEHVSYCVRRERDRLVTTQNVLGRINGTAHSDSTILVTAHYDHVGALGDSLYFPGANDNASGVALLLSLARHFEQHPLGYSLVFVAFSGEEAGLLGSRYFALHPPINLDAARFVLNLDMVASGEDGVVAVGGADFAREYNTLQAVNDSLRAGPLGKRRNAPNSDHYFITEQGVPGFYLYTKSGTQPYHHVRDVPATLEWEDFWHVYRLSRGFLQALSDPLL